MKTACATGGVCWVNESSRVRVVDEARNAAYDLSGDQAALWRWLHQDYPWTEICGLFAALAAVPAPQSETRILEYLRQWETLGLVERVDG